MHMTGTLQAVIRKDRVSVEAVAYRGKRESVCGGGGGGELTVQRIWRFMTEIQFHAWRE